ncbi:MAG: McrC family protein [Muribaculum sp.]|nr:McrC family protein [Muribaculum sp.]
MNITTVDNNCGNCSIPATASTEEVKFFSTLSGRSLKDLAAEHDLITIPSRFSSELETDANIYSMDCRNAIHTGNIVGFIGDGGNTLNITSRFDKEGNYRFILYMLCKVFSLNITNLENFGTTSNILDILPILFPAYLHKALTQGIYRPYSDIHHNDLRIRGRIDLNRHIKENIPFAGKVASAARERSADNVVMQLIRHTIEHICHYLFLKDLLSSNKDISDDISLIKSITSSYNRRDLGKVMNANQKITRHPYFTEYAPLQHLCLAILKRNKIAYNHTGKKMHGVLIDVAWLWEEYLASILGSVKIKHPRNRSGFGSIYISNQKISPNPHKVNFQERYPDMYNDNFVIDAKYKRDVSRDDYHQIITYMHIMGKNNGILLLPCLGETNSSETYVLNGFGGYLHLLKLGILQECDSFLTFREHMSGQENMLIEWLIASEQKCYT